MTKLFRAWAILAFAALLMPSLALAQTEPVYLPGRSTTDDNPMPVKTRCWSGTVWGPCAAGGGGGGSGTSDASAANQSTQITAANLTNTRLGDITSPAAGSANARLEAVRAAVAAAAAAPTPAGTNAIGSITNSAFGISGTLPAFASIPTFNLGTLNGAATAAAQGTMQTTLAAIQARTSPQEAFQLASNNTASTASTTYGGDYIFSQTCSGYGTVSLQVLGPNGSTYQTILTKSAADTAGGTGLALGSYASVQVTLSGTTGCSALLSRVP